MKQLLIGALLLLPTFTCAKHEFHHPQAFLQSIKDKSSMGKKIYQQFCSTCHAKQPMISLGAPRIGVKKEWQGRMKRSVAKMVKRIDPGLNAMPPRGGCFECSDEQLAAAIRYMLPRKPTKTSSS